MMLELDVEQSFGIELFPNDDLCFYLKNSQRLSIRALEN